MYIKCIYFASKTSWKETREEESKKNKNGYKRNNVDYEDLK
jgi:hypothetical protein